MCLFHSLNKFFELEKKQYKEHETIQDDENFFVTKILKQKKETLKPRIKVSLKHTHKERN